MEKIFVQLVTIFEISKLMGIDFVDFRRFQILPDCSIKLPVLLTKKREENIKIILKIFRDNKHFKNLNEKNYKDIYKKLVEGFKFDNIKCYLYKYKDFASNVLNSYYITGLGYDSNIKVKIKTFSSIQKRIIKINLFNNFASKDIFFCYLDSHIKNIPVFFAEFFSETPGRISEDFVKIVSELKVNLVRSSFTSIMLVIDTLLTKKDTEFIKYMLDSAGISNIVLIYFGDNDFIDFDLELKEKPNNLLKGCLRFEDKYEHIVLSNVELDVCKILKSISLPIQEENLSRVLSNKEFNAVKSLMNKNYLKYISGKIVANIDFSSLDINVSKIEEEKILKLFLDSTDSIDLKIKYFLNTNKLEKIKNILKGLTEGGYDIDFESVRKVLLKNLAVLEGDLKLIELIIEIFIIEYDLDSAKELLSYLKGESSFFINLKLAHIYKLEKDHQRMHEELRRIKGEIPEEFEDELCYLRFAYFDMVSDPKKADKWKKGIKSELYINLSHIQLSDRYIYKGEYNKAEILLKKGINYFNSKKFLRYELEAKNQFAKLLREKGYFKRAEKLYKNIFINSEIRNYKLLSAYISIDLGNLYWIQDNFNQAEFWYQRAFRIFQSQRNNNGTILAESNLIEINKIKGNWSEARSHLKSILKYDKEKNLITSIAIDYFNISHIEYLKLNFSKALDYLNKAISFFDKKKNLSGMIECEFLRLKIYFLTHKHRLDFSFLKKNLKTLNVNQKVVLSIFEILQKKNFNNKSSIIKKKIKEIESKSLKFELTSIIIDKFNLVDLLDLLKSLSIDLSKETKNFYYYEYYYIYFNYFLKEKKISEDETVIFNDIYYFFLKNKRKISQKIINLKNLVDEKDSISDIFKSAELVGDYIHWKIPEDFFNSLVNEIKKILDVDLIKLVIYEKDKFLFNFSNLNKFEKLIDEIIYSAITSVKNLNFDLNSIKRIYKSGEKAFYSYKNTKVILWKMSESLFGVLFLAFFNMDYYDYDFFKRNEDLLIKFASLIHRYYEYDFKLNKKLNFIIGESSAVKRLKGQILKVSKVDFSLLITGESGSGKELVAKAVHLLSNREKKPFIPVNSAAIPENLLEAELFGYKKGAFTGANESKIGLLEAADQGTLFLDEIADLPLNLQAKLLRVLQENEIRRLGENKTVHVNFRLISATNKDLENLIKKNLFRDDLYFRIQDLSIRVPSLKERKEDIPLLTRYFLKKNGFSIENKSELQNIVSCFQNQEWKGNIRELESNIKRLITYYPDFDMEENISYSSNPGLIPARESLEKSMIYQTLKENNWNKVKTAGQLKISRVYLFNLIKKYNITKDA